MAKPDWRMMVDGGRPYLLALLLSLLPAALVLPWSSHWDHTNIAMLFLLPVALSAVWLGRGPSILCAITGIALFDILFVPPRFSIDVHDARYLVTFAVMAAVALIISQLASSLRQQAAEALARERQVRELYELARQLTGVMSRDELVRIAHDFVHTQLHAGMWLALVQGDDLVTAVDDAALHEADRAAAMAVLEQGAALEVQSLCQGTHSGIFVPLAGATRNRGVLGVIVERVTGDRPAALKTTVTGLAVMLATAVERLHFVEVAHAAEVRMAAEQLRSSILSALSHDIRTPLAAIYGLAESLTLLDPPLPTEARETVAALRSQALQINALASNLLELARLQSGAIVLHREWQPLEEVIGASIQQLHYQLGGRRVRVELAHDLPLLAFDAVLVERVLCNLLDNACKYSPDGSDIVLAAALGEHEVAISVENEGSEFPAAAPEAVFDLFGRGDHTGGVPGSGVGLAVCRAIVSAHGGRISAANTPAGRARVTFTLPRGTPPEVLPETAGADHSAGAGAA